jgi:hypothetical protein
MRANIASADMTSMRSANEVEIDLTEGTVHPRTPNGSSRQRFDVALSFPGIHRIFVKDVALELATTYGRERVFYDEFYKGELASPNLDVYLQNIYRSEATLLVVFLSDGYSRSEWCGLEWRAIRELIKSKCERSVMLMRFDDTEVPGLLTIDGYLSVSNLTPAEVAAYIVQRVQFESVS